MEDIEQELRDLVREEVANSVPPVVFPDVQNVFVTNQQEIPAPIVNVPEPKVTVNVPEPKVTVNVPDVTVDNSEVARIVGELKDAFKPQSNTDLLEALSDHGNRLVEAYKEVKVIGGNASGSQALLNQAGTIINPATEAKQDDIITAIGAIPGGGGVQYTEGDTDATITGTAMMWEDAGNALVVASTSKPLPVSASIDTTGLALAANQLPDGHNVTVDNASLAVTGTFWQATQPVSVATVPSHDVTNAGTFAVQVTSAPTTAVTGTFWQATQPVSGTVTAAAQPGVDIGDVTINNASGASAVNIQDGGNTITVDGTVSANATLAAETTKVIGTVNQGTSPWVTSNATTSVVGNGAAATAQRVTLANDSTGIVALTTSTASIGKLAANSGVDIGDVDVLSIAAGTNAIGNVGIIPRTTGGATPYKLVSAATTNATTIKASAGQVFMVTASNVNAAVRYLKFYNKASAPTVGTDTPVLTFAIPGNTAGAGTNIPIPACGIAFGTGISFATTTEATDAGTTGVAANEIVINVAYA